MKKTKLDGLLLAIAIIGLILIAAFPIIIWDALGNGAQHFMTYGNPGVSGDSSGNSSATFLFGTFWTADFDVLKLYSGMWRVVEGVKQNTGTPMSDAMAGLTLTSVILLIVACIFQIAMPILNKIVKENPIVAKVNKWGDLGCAVFSLLTLIFVGLPVLIMASKVTKYGFRSYDFNAYGGVKGIMEIVVSLGMIAICTFRFVKNLKAPAVAEAK